MSKFKKYARLEVQTEMIACTHIVVMLWIYALEQLICKDGSLTFWQLLEMSVLGYAVAWGQQLLFWGDRVYSKQSYTVRSVLWIVFPAVLTVIFGECFKWFVGEPIGYSMFFYGFQLFYYACFWWILQVFFKKETKELNDWLADYKKES